MSFSPVRLNHAVLFVAVLGAVTLAAIMVYLSSDSNHGLFSPRDCVPLDLPLAGLLAVARCFSSCIVSHPIPKW